MDAGHDAAEGPGRDERGFTLIELMIVIAIIAIIAAIAIPNLLAAKLSANETAAIATLRNLTSCQAQIQSSAKVDADNDGTGEFGTFLEMTGAVGVRRGYIPAAPPTPSGSDFSVQGTKVRPALLSAVFATVDANGFVTKAGYAFMLFLPDNDVPAAAVHETGPAASVGLVGGTGAVGVDLAEQAWVAYAQPIARGNSGVRRFFVHYTNDVLQSSNDAAKQGGTAVAIDPTSAFRPTAAGFTGAIAVGTFGNDGDLWRVTN